MEINNLTIRKVHEGLINKQFSATEILESYIAKIEKDNKDINAFINFSFDLAKKQAQDVDRAIANHEEIDILAGVPMGLKDNILLQGYHCTSGSKILKDYKASYDATVVDRLKNRGAIILGKLNMDEFAMGSSGEYSAFGTTKNPIDKDLVPGGSSSGPASAVAGDMCVYSLGSDTGGSIRQPASFCGMVGLKPTYGSVSRFGLMALASSLDQIGPIAKTVDDCQIIFDAIKGIDKKDSTSIDIDSIKQNEFNICNLKIGIPKEYFVEGIDPVVDEQVKNAINVFKNAGAQIVEISLPHTQYALACYQILMTAEASSNLSRYDNIRYGNFDLINSDAKDLINVYKKSRGQALGDEVIRRIILGTYVLSAGYYDAYYLRAQKIRTLIRQDFIKAFENVDIIIVPTAPTFPFKFGQRMDDPVSMYLADIFTSPANIAGVPALSVPCQKEGMLPIGLQIIGNFYQESQILEAGKFFEQNK
jgi:aspartyl-tRNA(Asn)/glutamyl-tRNA(Gln) amidotransferase subunit A